MTEVDNNLEISDLSRRDWGNLCDAAERIRKLQPWKYFCEIDVAEIRMKDVPPVFCSIGGMFDEWPSVTAYWGEDGLSNLTNYITLRDAEVDPLIAEVRRECMEVSWGNRERLRSRDRKVLKAMGRSYRGRDVWPLFRGHAVGLETWFLLPEETLLLGVALTELANGLEDVLTDLDYRVMEDLDKRLIRRYDEASGEMVSELAPSLSSVSMMTRGCLITDELLIRRLRRYERCSGDLELDVSAIPLHPFEPDPRGERRIYPRVCALCDATTGTLEDSWILSQTENDTDVVLHMFIRYVKQHGRPVAVTVRDTYYYGILNHLCDSIGVEIYISPAMETMDEYMTDLIYDRNDAMKELLDREQFSQ